MVPPANPPTRQARVVQQPGPLAPGVHDSDPGFSPSGSVVGPGAGALGQDDRHLLDERSDEQTVRGERGVDLPKTVRREVTIRVGEDRLGEDEVELDAEAFDAEIVALV